MLKSDRNLRPQARTLLNIITSPQTVSSSRVSFCGSCCKKDEPSDDETDSISDIHMEDQAQVEAPAVQSSPFGLPLRFDADATEIRTFEPLVLVARMTHPSVPQTRKEYQFTHTTPKDFSQTHNA